MLQVKDNQNKQMVKSVAMVMSNKRLFRGGGAQLAQASGMKKE